MCKENNRLIENNLGTDVYIDLTTGLKNKNYIAFMLSKVIHNKGNINYSTILIDLDDFKTINDVLSYDFGDKVLKEVGKILSGMSNNKSIVTYSGSDRFLIIAFEEENINRYAEKILNNLRNTMIIEDIEVNITASIGIYINIKGEDTYTALQNADIALNHAKKYGKDCFSIFNELMKEDLFRKVKIQKNLKEAIKNDLMEVYYQPKINLINEKLIGAEALLRWRDKELGTISPGEFIPIAEETGTIIELGRYVLEKVCAQMKIWQASGINYISVAVNISGKQFRDKVLPEYIENLLREHYIPTNALELEITESAISENIEYADKILNELIKKDIKIALDDFGTGYSSYSHLSELSLNTLKIDKSFINFINCDFKKNVIVKNIIELGHALNMKVVAEGVEQEHQMKILKDYGCDIIQGYYYSKPLSVHNFEEYIMKKGGDI